MNIVVWKSPKALRGILRRVGHFLAQHGLLRLHRMGELLKEQLFLFQHHMRPPAFQIRNSKSRVRDFGARNRRTVGGPRINALHSAPLLTPHRPSQASATMTFTVPTTS